MMSILQPPRPPEQVASKETKVPVIKQVLHKLGIISHDPLDGLQSFHPPAYHPLTPDQEKTLHQSTQQLSGPTPLAIQLEEDTAHFEKKTETLMKTHREQETKQRIIRPIDPKEFLQETTYAGEAMAKSSFVHDAEIDLSRSLGDFGDEVTDNYEAKAFSEWTGHHEIEDGEKEESFLSDEQQ